MQINRVLKWLTAGTLLLALLLVNLSIFQKEQVLKKGHLVIMELAPVDPRSLMQGDYMALDYALARQLYQQLESQSQARLASTGEIVVELDEQHRALDARLAQGEMLRPQEVLMKYHLANHALHIGTPSYFFQEGHAERFEKARYGEFRVGSDGTALLTYLLDAQGKRILP